MNKRLLGIGLGLAMSMLTITSTFADNNTDILVNTAYEQLGKPYVFGSYAYEDSSHDCSSLMVYCYNKLGIDLPRCSVDQAEVGIPVTIDEIQEGDLVCMHTSDRNGAGKTSHVGMYVGDGKIIEARGRKWGVVITNLEDRASIITTIRRIINN